MTRVLDILDTLVSIESVTGRPNREIADFIYDFLKQRGSKVTKIASPSPEQFGVVASLGPETEGGILVSGHTDVVPVVGQAWTRPAFALTREERRVYGRGTTDMKGFLACMLGAAEDASKRDLRTPLKLVFSYDEEIGCVGIQQMAADLPAALGNPRACIVGEPTNMSVAIGHKGKIALKALCRGQAGHSALAPKFTNAIDLSTDFVLALRRMQSDLAERGTRDNAFDVPYSTVHVGQITGGRALNIVPEHAEVLFEVRHLAQDDPELIREALHSVADRINGNYPGGNIDIEEITAYPGLDVPRDSDVVDLCQTLAGTDEVTKVAFGTEAGVFQSLGIPTVICGPGSMAEQGHKPDESISLSELDACERMMDRLIDRLCEASS